MLLTLKDMVVNLENVSHIVPLWEVQTSSPGGRLDNPEAQWRSYPGWELDPLGPRPWEREERRVIVGTVFKMVNGDTLESKEHFGDVCGHIKALTL